MQGFSKRLKGLEPSTCCMASNRSSQLSYSRAESGL